MHNISVRQEISGKNVDDTGDAKINFKFILIIFYSS